MARNAKDNLVSYFHFDRMNFTQPEPGPWDGYIHKFMKGQCETKLIYLNVIHTIILIIKIIVI